MKIKAWTLPILVILLSLLIGGGGAAAGADGLTVHTAGQIRYVSGGIGKSEQLALEQAKPEYNLHLTFAHTGGAFLARLPVAISDESGQTVIEAVSRGPYFFARVPAGVYHVSAENDGENKTRKVTVPDAGAASEVFYWNP